MEKRTKILGVVAIAAVVTCAVAIPVGIYLRYTRAAEQLEARPTAVRLVSYALFTATATIEVDVTLGNPTVVDFPPVSGQYRLYVNDRDLGPGQFTDVDLPAAGNTSTTLTQVVSGASLVSAFLSFASGANVTVRFVITQITVSGWTLDVNYEQVQQVSFADLT